MKKTTALTLGAIAFAAPALINDAKAADDARVYYDNGVKIEAPAQGFSTQLNTLIINSYTFESNDGAKDKSNFDVNEARLSLKGTVLDKQFTYFLNGDFVGDKDESGKNTAALKDAWIQWNPCDIVQVRLGQWSTTFTRQQPLTDNMTMFPKDSIATSEFGLGRNTGVAVLGSDGKLEYAVGVNNGESEGEGESRPGQDTDLTGLGYVAFSDNYDRKTESDVKQTSGMGWTTGMSWAYSEAETAELSGNAFSLTGDVGMKSEGLSLIAEIMWRTVDLDDYDSTIDDLGYYVEAGYFFAPKEWEVAGRFSAVNYDSSGDEYEYNVFLNRYLNGNNLKVQTGVTFLDHSPEEGDSTQDTRYQMYVSGYF
ncbi:MAG: hypothetical protein IT292_03240 [Deltaproteobacteria bacterium]|nr:hypothetical protein [Deltaproteobacteria bacterium]